MMAGAFQLGRGSPTKTNYSPGSSPRKTLLDGQSEYDTKTVGTGAPSRSSPMKLMSMNPGVGSVFNPQ